MENEFKTITKEEIEAGFICKEMVEFEENHKGWDDLTEDELDFLIEILAE